jgi:predicted nuclease of predicted toxin-antitoxin system
MRILLDESLPKDLAALIVGHDVVTVRDAGWSSIKNGRLLALAAPRFDVFVTADKNLEFQQNLAALPIAVVVLHVLSTRIDGITPLLPDLLKLLNHLPPRVLRKVGT